MSDALNHRIVVIPASAQPGPELDALLAEVGAPTDTVTISGPNAVAFAHAWANSTRKNFFNVPGRLKEEARIIIKIERGEQ